MFCTFTTKDGTLVVRTQDIRRIEDRRKSDDSNTTECLVEWVRDDGVRDDRVIAGTAAENLARLVAEDQAKSAAYAQAQQRAANGLPALPVPRGKAGR